MALEQGEVTGTQIDVPRLVVRAGGIESLAAHLLGRTPDAAERVALASSPRPLALLLASPAFQRC